MEVMNSSSAEIQLLHNHSIPPPDNEELLMFHDESEFTHYVLLDQTQEFFSWYLAVLKNRVQKSDTDFFQWNSDKCAVPLECYMASFLPDLHKAKVVA